MFDSTHSDDPGTHEDPQDEDRDDGHLADETSRDRRPLRERARPLLDGGPFPGLECGPLGPWPIPRP